MAAGATYEPIATTTLTGTASTITFSSIPSTYTDLVLTMVATSASVGDVRLQFNSDTGTNYSTTVIDGNGTSATSASQTSATYVYLTYTGAGTNTLPHFYSANIFSYAGSTNKTVLGMRNEDNNNGLNGSSVARTVSLWRNTAAITRIDIIGATYAIGTTATLYGIKAA